ncbi:MAG: MG2 domain-containing protein [Candidatus Azobacteroides sp.]|nr:MG2 domain-containing protein [Candidatus Azobacteroides sp.]
MKRIKIFSFLGVALFWLLTMSSCRKETVPVSEFVPYVNAYTGGLIYPSSNIRIELANEQTTAKANTEIKEKLFSFSPSIKGKTYWVDNRTIEFIPETGALKGGRTYRGGFKLGKLIKVDKRLKVFNFSFKVEEKSCDMQINALDIADPALVSATGLIYLNFNADLEAVKKMFSVQIDDNQTLSPILEEGGNPRTFRFIIKDIKRKEKDLGMDIRFGGKAMGIGKTISRTLIIPALGVFNVLWAELISEPENGVLITFSDPISTSQDLKGLITIPEVSQFTYQVQNNKISVYFERKGLEDITVEVNRGIKNTQGEKMTESFSSVLSILKLKPQVELLRSGNILPNSGNLLLPFRAVNLKAVDLKIIKIFENNVLMFLQTNSLDGTNELRRAGRLVYKKTIYLDVPNPQDWQNYSIDLSRMMHQDPGAIYRIELSFKQDYSAYPCGDAVNRPVLSVPHSDLIKIQSDEMTEEDENYWDSPYSSYDNDYDWDNYDWDERDNPCSPSYYMGSDTKASCNVVVSDIGVIAKSNSDNQWWIALSNILDAKPIAGAEIILYNYQLQPIATAKSGSDGFAMLTPKGKPFILVASSGKGQKTYLRLVDGEENSLSRFDVGGKEINKGIKGYIYGERGVWRPGDTLHVTFILNDPEKRIPENHPVSFELYNARGQFYSKQIITRGVNGFYTYAVPTKDDDPTGLWNAYVKVGGTSFQKSFRIETIKPNRLKINLSLPGRDRIDADQGSANALLTSSWLTGVVARNLKAKVEMTLTKTNTQFKGFENYLFNNPASDFSTNESEIFDGALNESGEVNFNFKTPKAENAPGMLNANIVCRVFEQGGDASIYTQNIPYSPFSSYVGVNLNQPSDRYIETDTDHRFDVVTVNANGKPVDRNNLEYKIYRIGWSWWWEQNSESFSTYVNGSSYEPVAQGKLKTSNGKANFFFLLKYPEWGRYLVYVKDKDSGHAAGGVVYIDWPDWRGRSNKSDPDNIKMLSFSTNKTSYEVGEEVTVIIPASGGGGNALVALENGSTVLNRSWVSLSEKGDTKYTFKATPEMSPNFYIHISLLQPHAQKANDLPIRMYGVMPVKISNKESILNPQIDMPDVLRPETEFTVEVSEKNGKPMTYTLAIVDDGLLDLTNFKTPDPWNEFYAREALGIRTWDMFDYVMGAFTGKYSAMFSVGGDEDMKPANTKANRFKPVVKYLGPFALSKGEKKKHKIVLPVYVGSVRTMVVAGQDGAYGKAEKTTPVRTPLMILSSLPRVVSANEEITLPVNVFAMENTVKDVSVKVETTGLLQVDGAGSRSVRFSQPGDEMAYFSMKTGSKTGIEKVTITATGGGKTSKETIEIDVRNPNPAIILSDNKLLNAGESGEFDYQLTGVSDDDWVKLDVSRIPSVDLSRRFDFLYNYEHYCSEQLTSRALPLLHITQFKDVDAAESDAIKKNIREAIKNLYGRQLTSGGIVYWPGQSSADDWITSYAGSFLVLAKEKGYEVNNEALNRWKNYQRKGAQNWSPTTSSSDNYYLKSSELQQAYRLYTLALAGVPELGAMNRLKETKNLSLQARWCLAAAYALNGKNKPAEELIFNIPSAVESYYSSYTYGSSDRDEAMILQTLVLMGRLKEAFQQAQRMSQKLSQQNYYDTQSTAFILVAMGSLAEKTSGSIEFDWTLNGKKQEGVRSAKAAYSIQAPKRPSEGKLFFTNRGKGTLYVNLVSKSKPLNDTLPAVANNLRLNVSYTDLSGKPVDITELKQGSDFVAVVEVANTNSVNDYTDLALTHIIPSGWEIFNEQMTGSENSSTVSDAYTYRDIRDDRVLTYFDLPRGKSKTIKVRLQASYAGSFVLPAILCEAMYDTTTQARTEAGRVKVTR